MTTRFRAYYLGTKGASYSYFDGTTFTLVEGRLNDYNKKSVVEELTACAKSRIDVLHITSWDTDHCQPSELEIILSALLPAQVEIPGYFPTTDSGRICYLMIMEYKVAGKIQVSNFNSEFHNSLVQATPFTKSNVVFNFLGWAESNNDRSSIKLFRTGEFTVASTGDVESSSIGIFLKHDPIFSNEVDVMVLPHHGAESGFLDRAFFESTKPTVAIACSDYGNQFEHPSPSVRSTLFSLGIPLLTTKEGDVFIVSGGGYFSVQNWVGNNSKLDTAKIYVSKAR